MFFTNPNSQMRNAARGWLELADKIRHYRRDQMSDITLLDLRLKTEALRARVREKADAARLKLAIEELEPVLARTGGRIYPRSGTTEWVEFLVVGLILILTVRQFFFQPFQIPTNSMWPSYNGMVPEVHATPADEPGAIARALRYFTLGASAFRVDAPVDGEILIPVEQHPAPKTGRTWLVFPQPQLTYDLYVDGPNGAVKVPLSVPKDFDFNLVLRDAFASQLAGIDESPGSQEVKNSIVWRELDDAWGRKMQFIRTGKRVRAGERVLSFDIISGDRLLVDRMSYHFVRPSVGEGFVFHTTNIPGTVDRAGNHIESYYIKRLVGLPGDTLQIRPPVLYRKAANGDSLAPITGAQAFYDNNNQTGRYRGYTNPNFHTDPRYGARYLTSPEKTFTVSNNGYFALGDNSNNSADSRYFGEVPKKDAVGRPIWVFYPFGKHWGPAR